MVKCIGNSSNITSSKLNIIIFFGCLLIIAIQSLVDYYNNSEFDIKHFSKKMIILIIFCIIMIFINSISFEDKGNTNEKKKLINNTALINCDSLINCESLINNTSINDEMTNI